MYREILLFITKVSITTGGMTYTCEVRLFQRLYEVMSLQTLSIQICDWQCYYTKFKILPVQLGAVTDLKCQNHTTASAKHIWKGYLKLKVTS